MIKVVEIEALEGFRLRLRFSDGASAISDLSELIASDGPMLEPLRAPPFFARVFIEQGCPTWPNGLDLDPEALYRELIGKKATAAA
jgi:hypothetical protein